MKTAWCVAVVVLLSAARASAALPESLSLEEAVQLAKDRQPALRAARAQAEAAVARSREAFAPMLPTISAGLSYSRSTANFVARPGSVPSSINTTSTITLNSYDYFTGNITASATLWDFFQGWNRYQSSLSTADAQAAQLHAAEVSALLAVRTAWNTARAQKDLVAVAQATLANTEAHYAQIEGFVKVGTRPEIDLAQSRSARATAQLGLLTAKNNYAVARAKLSQAIGVEASPAYDVVGELPSALEGEEKTVDALMPEALASRPEVAGLAANVKAQDFIIRSTKGAFLPTLGAQVSGTAGAADLAKTVPNLSAQLTLNWQLWQGGLTVAQVTEGEATLRQLEAQRDALALQVRLDVETAWLGVGSAREGVDVAQEAAAAAREQLKLAEGRYRAGAGNSLELSDAQVASTTAEVQVVQARANLAIARSQLVAALGRP